MTRILVDFKQLCPMIQHLCDDSNCITLCDPSNHVCILLAHKKIKQTLRKERYRDIYVVRQLSNYILDASIGSHDAKND